MSHQQMQNCCPVTVNSEFESVVDWIIATCREWVAKYDSARERKALYQYYRHLDAARLHDIGMDDPQKQLEVLGRYL